MSTTWAGCSDCGVYLGACLCHSDLCGWISGWVEIRNGYCDAVRGVRVRLTSQPDSVGAPRVPSWIRHFDMGVNIGRGEQLNPDAFCCYRIP